MTGAELSIHFFLQMAVIIASCYAVGRFGQRYLGQPQVVGEMIAGVLLGPSLFGAIAPELQAMLFPPDSKAVLYVGAQLGVGLYMFLVGLEFDRSAFKANARGAALISFAGMAAPFAAAALLVPWMMGVDGLFAPGVNGAQAVLFLGSAIAITAFPMLARIIHERGISGTVLGALSLAAGAIGDAGAWAVIAIVLASLGDGPMVAVLAIGGGLSFAVLMVLVAPKLLARLGDAATRDEAGESGGVGHGLLALVLILYLLCAFAMDAIGMHAVFGGFLLGTAMPRGALARDLRAKLEPFTTIFLLPMFFTYSGLNTQLFSFVRWDLLAITAAVLAASILAKGGASYVAARVAGQDHGSAMGIGALMNARGLMELIIINIGLQRGIIGPALFAMLVLMAIVTTLLASPLFEAFYGKAARARGEI